MGERRSVGAATIAEAFRLTVEDNADRIAVRTKDDEIAWTWTELAAKGRCLRGRPGQARRDARRHGRADGLQPAGVHGRRPRGHDARRHAVLDLPHSAPDQIAYVIKDAGARVAIVEAPFKDCGGAARRVRDHRRGDGRARGTGLCARLARGPARRHPHDHLHVGHDRPAEGRPAHPRERDGGRGRGGEAGRLPGRRRA